MATRANPQEKPEARINFADGIDIRTPAVPMRKVLTATTLPATLKHLEPLIAQLPLNAMVGISAAAIKAGLNNAEYERALKDAIAFQEKPAHRCGACFQWVDPPFLVLSLVGSGRMVFAAACRRCEKLIDKGRATRQMQENLESLIDDELTGGTK